MKVVWDEWRAFIPSLTRDNNVDKLRVICVIFCLSFVTSKKMIPPIASKEMDLEIRQTQDYLEKDDASHKPTEDEHYDGHVCHGDALRPWHRKSAR
jgi:hypothetical protein